MGWTAEGFGVRFPRKATDFSLFHSVQTGIRNHTAWYAYRRHFSQGKKTEART
jgi:hypothetical protein